jgi:hypothetical protein
MFGFGISPSQGRNEGGKPVVAQKSEAPRPQKLTPEEKAHRLRLIVLTAQDVRRRRAEMHQAKREIVGR